MSHKVFKPISIIVLFSFLWTFGGFCEIAYAFKSSSQHTVDSSQEKTKRPEEKFEKAIEDIEKILSGRLSDVSIQQEIKGNLKTKKAEIENLDIEIRKQFRETEEKIKDLPEEIKQRHKDFVKHYEDNLNELKANLEAIDRATTKGEVDSAIEKAKAHLEKVKPPKKHIPLDPNKLPHRTAEPVWIEPRLNYSDQVSGVSEQEIKDSGQLSAFSRQPSKPILVASNGPLTGLLDSDSTLNATSYPLYAQVSAPTPADLAETIEVQFTPEIRAKAQELNYNPVKIYNWVRNNIEFVPTYGSIQGANMCLQTKQCNDFDTASLLIALLRASNIPARYVYGTIELPVEKVMNWVGGFTDPNAALNLIASGGIPVKGLTSGGKIVMVRMEHVWVEAWVDYIPSRGARHKEGDTWIPLDASFKQYNFTQGIDIKSAVPFDAQSFIEQIKSTATINEAEGYVTNVNSLFIQQTMTDYQTQVQDYIMHNYPNATVGDMLGKKEIIKQEFSYLLGTLPYKRIVTGAKYSSLPDNLRHKITFSVIKDIYDEYIGTPINIIKSLPEIAGKKITLSYSPATPQDEAVINSYIPKPNPDGTIDPSKLPTSLPAYLINLKPELRIDGTVIATGSTVNLGWDETFTMTFTAPKQSPGVVTNVISAGGYYAIAIAHGRISEAQMLALKTKLEATKAKLQTQDFIGLTKDDILGDLLYTTALAYFAEIDMIDFVTAKTIGVVNVRLPSESIFSNEVKTRYMFGTPMSVSAGGLAMDIDRDISITVAIDGDKNKAVQFTLASGMNGSALEHGVPEQMFSTPENPAQGISAMKALKIANDQGIPIYTINQTNINTILPQLQVSGDVKTDIQNAVNTGKEVTVSKTNITFNGWIGVGYIIIDPTTGAGAYMISGGLSGGWILVGVGVLLMIISLMTGEFGPQIALLILGLLYVGIGLCILSESDVPLQVALAAIGFVISYILLFIPGVGPHMVGQVFTLLWTILGVKSTDDVKKFCEGK
jgi:uncharacterized membrane-anchored protein YhcB (DUF1043 family)